MTEPAYRLATPDDAGVIAAVIAEVLAEPDPVGFDRPWSADDVRTWIGRLGGGGGIYLAEVEGELAGFGALDYNTQEPDTATLGVWIRATQRRLGIGTALAERLLGLARDRGYQRIVGRLPERNEPALSFLSAIGGLVPIFNPGTRFELPL